MFRSSSITSGIRESLVAHYYEDHYICVSDFMFQGLDSPEYYFLARQTYEAADSDLRELYARQNSEGGLKEISTSLLEDPVLISSDKKYAIFLRREFGHFVFHTLVTIAQIHEEDPDGIIVLFVPTALWADSGWLIKINEYLVKFFSDNSIKYYFVKDSTNQIENANYLGLNSKSSVHSQVEKKTQSVDHFFIYKVNNLFGVDANVSTGRLYLGDIKHLLDKYVNAFSVAESDIPGRKIYTTRRNYASESNAFAVSDEESDQVSYKSNRIRIYEENLLEEYMSSKGFEIVDFDSMDRIEDQINMMASTAVLVGATGTGLTNQLFMKDGQTVIELRIEHGDMSREHWMLVEYFLMSGAKQHVYLGVDVRDKQSLTAVEKLDKVMSLVDIGTGD